VLLKEKHGERTLPIWIGPAEALAIEGALAGEKFARPLTHDLLKILIDTFQAKLVKIVVVELKNEIYFAKLYLESGGSVYAIDARPSDSIALALRTKSAIFVDPKIMNENGWVLEGDQNVSQLISKLRNTKPEQFGNFNLDQ
jgi:bifunctional DNase/RNase